MVSGVSSAGSASAQSQIQQLMQQYGCSESQAEAISGGEAPSEALGQSTSGTQSSTDATKTDATKTHHHHSKKSESSIETQSTATDSEPQDPSTVTSAQLESPIDLKI